MSVSESYVGDAKLQARHEARDQHHRVFADTSYGSYDTSRGYTNDILVEQYRLIAYR